MVEGLPVQVSNRSAKLQSPRLFLYVQFLEKKGCGFSVNASMAVSCALNVVAVKNGVESVNAQKYFSLNFV